MKRRGKIAVGVIISLIVFATLEYFGIMDLLRMILYVFVGIELPVISLPKPEIVPRGKIAFLAGEPWKVPSICILDINSKNITQLVRSVKTGTFLSWSPDGEKIVYCDIGSFRDGGNNICVVNMRGEITQLTHTSGILYRYSRWSPDGKKIIFSAGPLEKNKLGGWEPTRVDIYIMNADGTNITKIVENGDAPAWSPDGKKIAFISPPTGHPGLYIMDIESRNVTKLVEGEFYANADEIPACSPHDPTWSPDGKKIAFVAYSGGFPRTAPAQPYTPTARIFIVNIDGGGNPIMFIPNSKFNEIRCPSYSPDGKKIIFHAMFFMEGEDKAKIYAINAEDGTNLIELAKGVYPTFSPP